MIDSSLLSTSNKRAISEVAHVGVNRTISLSSNISEVVHVSVYSTETVSNNSGTSEYNFSLKQAASFKESSTLCNANEAMKDIHNKFLIDFDFPSDTFDTSQNLFDVV